MERATDGILLTDKGHGETSYSIVKKVKALFRGGNPVKVGHAGTLDPFATGLLIILLGQGTKISQFIMSAEKVYLATMELGVETDTLDPTGKVLRTSHVPELRPGYIREIADRFVGKVRQVPPAYSAIKYKGTRAYKLARSGRAVDLKAREITVYSLNILNVDLPQITMRIRCSSGTYIRSLAADFGKDLGPGGHLRSLRRIKSGRFAVEDALPSSEIMNRAREGFLSKRVLTLRDALPEMGEVVINAALAEKVRHGYQPVWQELIVSRERKTGSHPGLNDGWIKLVSNNKLVAITKINLEEEISQIKVKVERVFSA